MTTHPPRRLLLLCGLSAVLGLAAGGAAWVLIQLIAILTNLLLFHRWGTTLPNFAELTIGPVVVITAMAGGAVVTLLAAVGADHPGPRHPRGDGGGPHPAQPRVAPHRGRQAAVGRRRDRHRRPVRRRGPDHRHRRRDRLAARSGDPRVGQRAQDPARVRAPPQAWPRRSAHRSPRSCSRSSCCCSSSRRERSSRSSSPRASPAACTSCSSATGRCSPCPRHGFAGLGQLPLFAALGHRLRAAGRRSSRAGSSRRGRVPAAPDRGGLAPGRRRDGVGVPRAVRAAGARRRLRRHRRRPRRPARPRHARRRWPSASW